MFTFFKIHPGSWRCRKWQTTHSMKGTTLSSNGMFFSIVAVPVGQKQFLLDRNTFCPITILGRAEIHFPHRKSTLHVDHKICGLAKMLSCIKAWIDPFYPSPQKSPHAQNKIMFSLESETDLTMTDTLGSTPINLQVLSHKLGWSAISRESWNVTRALTRCNDAAS